MSTSVRRYRTVSAAVRASLEELDLGEEDHAAAALALRVSRAIDDEKSGRTVAELAGKLLAVLESLGATPAARKAVKGSTRGGDQGVGDGESDLERIRKRRAARKHGAAAVDAPSS